MQYINVELASKAASWGVVASLYLRTVTSRGFIILPEFEASMVASSHLTSGGPSVCLLMNTATVTTAVGFWLCFPLNWVELLCQVNKINLFT